eukprot:4842655-Prymnesium_polylepis.1
MGPASSRRDHSSLLTSETSAGSAQPFSLTVQSFATTASPAKRSRTPRAHRSRVSSGDTQGARCARRCGGNPGSRTWKPLPSALNQGERRPKSERCERKGQLVSHKAGPAQSLQRKHGVCAALASAALSASHLAARTTCSSRGGDERAEQLVGAALRGRPAAALRVAQQRAPRLRDHRAARLRERRLPVLRALRRLQPTAGRVGVGRATQAARAAGRSPGLREKAKARPGGRGTGANASGECGGRVGGGRAGRGDAAGARGGDAREEYQQDRAGQVGDPHMVLLALPKGLCRVRHALLLRV